MKSILNFLFLVGMPLFILACSSKNDDPAPQSEGFFRFKVDGVQKEFPVNDLIPMTFTYDAGGPVYQAIFQALGKGSNGSANFANVIVRSESKFAAGVDYDLQNGVPYRGIPLARINFTYADEAGQIFNAVLLQSSVLPLVVNDASIIRFTKITATEVEGVFSARVIGPVSTTTGRGTTEKVITDGQFKMKLLDNTN